MKNLTSIILSAVAIISSAQAATLITTGETIDMAGTTLSINPAAPGGTNLITHNGGSSYTIASTPPNSDFYISFANSNVDPDFYDYLQINFAAGMTVTSAVSFQLFLADGNTFVAGDMAANVIVTPSTGAFSILFDLSGAPTATWDDRKSGGVGGVDIDGVRLDTFNGAAYAGQSFTITGITFGDTLIPEPSAAVLSCITGLGLLLRRRRS